MKICSLRELLRPRVGDLKDHCTNTTMPAFCTQLGLPTPPEGGDKRGRMHAAFDSASDDTIPELAHRMIVRGHLVGELRNEVQELLWDDGPSIEVPKRARRELAKALQNVALFHRWDKFKVLLDSIFLFRPDLSIWTLNASDRDPIEAIRDDFVRNQESVEWLFDELEVYELSDNRFRKFLEGVVSADVQKEEENQVAVAAAINSVLRNCGVELRETGEDGGYPLYEIVLLRTSRGRPKNLIFASTSKPDIRIRDAVNNDIEIASDIDDVLVYDRPLGSDGLRWKELQAWWAEATGESEAAQAKRSLYLRLLSCLPESSPPQRLLFKSFFASFREAVANLPALLPEVWLHWDPKTVKERGPSALLTHRMDFLMLMPSGGRVVLEVDGQQHYADHEGRADPRRYARLAAGQRELVLAGYEVHRFAGVELRGDDGPAVVKSFFERLFKCHGVSVPA